MVWSLKTVHPHRVVTKSGMLKVNKENEHTLIYKEKWKAVHVPG